MNHPFAAQAYAITDVSLCAPFLAFDPVMQFLLPALLAPLACAAAGVGCADAKTSFPPGRRTSAIQWPGTLAARKEMLAAGLITVGFLSSGRGLVVR